MNDSTYQMLRHFADSWGLLAMALVFVCLVGWALRPQARNMHDDAANMIFKEDDNG